MKTSETDELIICFNKGGSGPSRIIEKEPPSDSGYPSNRQAMHEICRTTNHRSSFLHKPTTVLVVCAIHLPYIHGPFHHELIHVEFHLKPYDVEVTNPHYLLRTGYIY